MGYAEAIAAAAELAIQIAPAAIDGIWKATGMANKPYVHAFYVDTMAAHSSHGDRHNLQDGDHICIYARPKQPTSKKTRFHIALKQPTGTWWKAITAHTPPNTFSHEIVWSQDDTHENWALVDYNDMLNYFIVLSKAKAFGIHTNMYWIQNSYDFKPTSDWIISWDRD